jgi:hypothetical protein
LAALVLAPGIVCCLHSPDLSNAGGYFLTDREGKANSESREHVVVIGPEDNAIILMDRGDRRVFDLSWDANEHSLVIKGDRVHLKVHRDGTVEKWAAFPEGQGQPPLLIEPVVPYTPRVLQK